MGEKTALFGRTIEEITTIDVEQAYSPENSSMMTVRNRVVTILFPTLFFYVVNRFSSNKTRSEKL